MRKYKVGDSVKYRGYTTKIRALCLCDSVVGEYFLESLAYAEESQLTLIGEVLVEQVHKSEIIRLANSPQDTYVWFKQEGFGWCRLAAVVWGPENKYIVDDEFAEIRKAFVDGKQIQHKILWADNCPKGWNRDWVDYNCRDSNMINGYYNGTKQIYRVKVEKEYRWQWLYSEIKCKILQLTLSHYATSEDAMRCLRIEGIYAKKDLRKLEETKKEFKC